MTGDRKNRPEYDRLLTNEELEDILTAHPSLDILLC